MGMAFIVQCINSGNQKKNADFRSSNSIRRLWWEKTPNQMWKPQDKKIPVVAPGGSISNRFVKELTHFKQLYNSVGK